MQVTRGRDLGARRRQDRVNLARGNWAAFPHRAVGLKNEISGHDREVEQAGPGPPGAEGQGYGMLLAVSEWVQPRPGEEAEESTVRYRTVGDMSCTGAIESAASTIPAIIEELAATRITERGATRADDRFSEAAMEDRKKEGYF